MIDVGGTTYSAVRDLQVGDQVRLVGYEPNTVVRLESQANGRVILTVDAPIVNLVNTEQIVQIARVPIWLRQHSMLEVINLMPRETTDATERY